MPVQLIELSKGPLKKDPKISRGNTMDIRPE